jgi:hypothetical protein
MLCSPVSISVARTGGVWYTCQYNGFEKKVSGMVVWGSIPRRMPFGFSHLFIFSSCSIEQATAVMKSPVVEFE